MYIIFEIQIPPPPFLIYIFSPTDNYSEGVRAAGENFQPFFTILYILSQLGEKYAFPPLFYPLSPLFFYPLSIIFPPACYLAIFFGQTVQHTPLVCML